MLIFSYVRVVAIGMHDALERGASTGLVCLLVRIVHIIEVIGKGKVSRKNE